MKVTHVEVFPVASASISFDTNRHRELHLLFRDGYAIVNYQEGSEQASHAYPICSTELVYTKPITQQ